MPVRIDLQLKTSSELNVQMSSLFHGLLMEQLEEMPELQEQLHQSLLHPYSQHLECRDDVWHWIIAFTDDSIFEKIWNPCLSKQKIFFLRHNEIRLEIENVQISQQSIKEMSSLIMSEETATRFRINFLTPTAFKSNGKYVFIPDLGYIYNSIMRKFDAVAGESSFYDEDTLEQMCRASCIQDYRLRSTRFSLEGVKIHSFVGNIIVNAKGNRTMAAFLSMLLSFAEYSGVGIKTSLGMGAIQVEKIY